MVAKEMHSARDFGCRQETKLNLKMKLLNQPIQKMKTRFSILNLMIFLMIIAAGAVNAKSDSHPSGFTRDWLNSLTNENGQ
jgi:hypothetical protein